jgi:cytochrome c oxidase subunit 2
LRKHLVIVSFISIALAAVLIFLLLNYDLIPRSGSAEHSTIDQLMKVLAIIAIIFFSIIITVIIYNLILFHRRRGETGDGPPIKGNSVLELVWTAIPLAIVIGLSAYGGLILANITKPGPPQSELEVNVTAFRFGWQFNYPQYGNVQTFQLGLALDRRTVFYIQSKDVVHSFWVPEFGPKQDAVPGLTTVLRYTPDKAGQFTVQCSQLCGYGHSDMVAPVSVMSSANFEQWVAAQPKATPSPTASPGPPASTASTATQTPGPAGAVINLAAQNMQFSVNTITVPAGSKVTIQFNNKDASVPHNFAAYSDSSATNAIFVGQIITGPATITYTFRAPTAPGSYFFRCDVHPTTMNGTFRVQ